MTVAAPLTRTLGIAEKAEFSGDYEEGLKSLLFFWDYRQPEISPDSSGFDYEELAVLFFRCGILYGYYGTSKPDAQEVSRNFLTKALTFYENQEDCRMQAAIFNYLAISYWRLGELNEAKTWLATAFDFKLKNGDQIQLHSFIVESLIFLTSGDYEYVLERLKKVKNLFTCASSDFLKAMYFINLALAEKNLNLPQHAIKNLLTSRRFVQNIENSKLSSLVENNLARVFQSIGDINNAFLHAGRSLNISIKLNDIRQQGCVYDTHAWIAIEAGVFEMALHYSEKAISNLEKTENYGYLVEALETQMLIFLEMERYNEALETYNRAVELARTYISLEKANSITRRFADFIKNKVFVSVYIECGLLSGNKSFDLNFKTEKPNGKLSCVEIVTSRYESLGIPRGGLAVVANEPYKEEELIALIENETGRCFLGVYSHFLGNITLRAPQGFSVYFTEADVEILGKVVGYCDEPTNSQFRLDVKPLRIEK